MNDFFHFNRFRLYFVKSILERPVQTGGTFALSFSVTALVYLLFKSMANIGLAQFMSFTLGLVGGGCLLASQVFGFFADTGNGASFFTLPVSAFEKWLTGVILVVLYVGCFLLFSGDSYIICSSIPCEPESARCAVSGSVRCSVYIHFFRRSSIRLYFFSMRRRRCCLARFISIK